MHAYQELKLSTGQKAMLLRIKIYMAANMN